MGDFNTSKLSIQDGINLRVNSVNGVGAWNGALSQMPGGAAEFRANPEKPDLA